MRTLTVLELTRHIKDLLENDHLLAGLWVKGEISNFKRAASGHLYLTLKDEYCNIRVVMFRSRAQRLNFRPRDGMGVRIRGYVSLYERDGSYQLYAEEMEPEGMGALHQAFEELKARLAAEGLFDPAHKKSLPPAPARVGVVTSPVGAVIRDVVEIIGRRWPLTEIVVAPAPVQGDQAPREIARGIRRLNLLGGVDIIIVCRGGGSLEELWAFNTEEVARAVFESEIPVVSAVGHETDYTISDLVADLRAPTPSAAAGLVVPDRLEIRRHLGVLSRRLQRAVTEQIKFLRRRVDNCVQARSMRRPKAELVGARQQQVDGLVRRQVQAAATLIQRDRGRLAVIAGKLDSLSPVSILARGYSICARPDGTVLRDSAEAGPGDEVNVTLHRGRLKCRVE
ncbi:MAG: exodeoxyribonuclease VII large subunit [Bacillota bacterium]